MAGINANALAAAYEAVDSPTDVIISSSANALMMAVGLGVCGTMSVQTLRAEKRSVGSAILWSILLIGVLEFALLLADFAVVVQNSDEMGNFAWLDVRILLGAYQCTTLIAYAAHWFFGLRVWQLYSTKRKRLVCIPIFLTAHLSLVGNFVLSVKGYTQPQWNNSSSQEQLMAVTADILKYKDLRSIMQVVWMCGNLASDVLICTLIVAALMRMKTFLDTTQGVIHRMALMTSQTMLPPMLMAILWTGVVMSKRFGAGSWFRILGPLQSLFYWFAVLWSIRTRKSFLDTLNPARPPPTIIAHGSPAMSIGFDLEPVSCTLVPEGSYSNLKEKMDLAAAYSQQEQLQILTIDEALKDPNREDMV